MAGLLPAAAAVHALIVPLDHGAPFVVGLIATSAVVGGGAYAASVPAPLGSSELSQPTLAFAGRRRMIDSRNGRLPGQASRAATRLSAAARQPGASYHT